MSVRATDSLIADVVVASGLSNSPKMVVQAVNPDLRTVTTVWFSDRHDAQQGVFPAGSLDRAELTTKPSKVNKPAGKVGKKPSSKK
jgi:hypothetical protein